MNKRGIDDQRLAEVMNVSRTTVLRWRKGERSPKLNKIAEIARYFQVSPKYFLEEDVTEEDNSNVETIAAHIDNDASEEEIKEILDYIELMKLKYGRK